MNISIWNDKASGFGLKMDLYTLNTSSLFKQIFTLLSKYFEINAQNVNRNSKSSVIQLCGSVSVNQIRLMKEMLLIPQEIFITIVESMEFRVGYMGNYFKKSILTKFISFQPYVSVFRQTYVTFVTCSSIDNMPTLERSTFMCKFLIYMVSIILIPKRMQYSTHFNFGNYVEIITSFQETSGCPDLLKY